MRKSIEIVRDMFVMLFICIILFVIYYIVFSDNQKEISYFIIGFSTCFIVFSPYFFELFKTTCQKSYNRYFDEQ